MPANDKVRELSANSTVYDIESKSVLNQNSASGATENLYDWVGTLSEYTTQAIATNHPDWICYITDDLSGSANVYTKAEVDSLIPTIVSSVSASSTNNEAVGAKLFYDTCGDIETLINAL